MQKIPSRKPKSVFVSMNPYPQFPFQRFQKCYLHWLSKKANTITGQYFIGFYAKLRKKRPHLLLCPYMPQLLPPLLLQKNVEFCFELLPHSPYSPDLIPVISSKLKRNDKVISADSCIFCEVPEDLLKYIYCNKISVLLRSHSSFKQPSHIQYCLGYIHLYKMLITM